MGIEREQGDRPISENVIAREDKIAAPSPHPRPPAAPQPSTITRQPASTTGPPPPVTGHPSLGTRYVVLVWLCAAAAIAYLSRNCIAVMESTIRDDLGISEKQMGFVMSAFFLTYAVGQLPTGWLGDYWGSRRSIPLFSLVWSAASGVFGLVGHWLWFVLSRGVGGLAQAGLFPCCTNSISHWFPPTQRGFPSGALASCMSIGGAVAVLLTGLLLPLVGWRMVFVLFALPGMLWAVGFWWWFRDQPEEHPSVTAAELEVIRAGRVGGAEGAREPTPWLALLTSPAMWWINLQQFFRAAGYIFFASWFPTYLQETRGVSVKGSALLTVLPLLAVVVGSPLGGGICDALVRRTGNLRLARSYYAAGCLLVCAALIFSAYLVADPLLAVAVISVGAFCFALGGPCAYAITIDMGGKHVATVFSMMNMSGNLGATLMPIAVPFIKEWGNSWDVVLWLFGGVYLAASFSWLMLQPAGTVFDQALVRRKG